MHSHVSIVPPGRFVDYVTRHDAVILGGGLNASTWPQLRRRLSAVSGGKDVLHLTISLPEGRTSDRPTLLRIVATDLKERGLPPKGVPWIAVLHRDTNCLHIHAAVVCRTWNGRWIEPAVSEGTTRRISKRLMDTFGLAPIEMFDPAAPPRLVPHIPKRRRRDKASRRLADRLAEIFRQNQPTDVEGLQKALADGGPWRLEERTNPHEVESFHVTGGGFEGFLGYFGAALRPAAMRRRFALAGVLRKLRPIVEMRLLLHRLVEAEQLKKEDPATYDRLARTPSGTLPGRPHLARTGNPDADPAPAAAARRHPDLAAGSGGGGHGDPPARPDDAGAGDAGDRAEGTGGGLGAARERGAPAPGGDGRACEGSRTGIARAGADRPYVPEAEPRDPLTVGRWLGLLCRFMAGKGYMLVSLDWSTGRPEPIIIDGRGMPVPAPDDADLLARPAPSESEPEDDDISPGF